MSIGFLSSGVEPLSFSLSAGFAVLLGLSPIQSPGIANYTRNGGFLPKGLLGLWFSIPFALISFFGIELISITAGEVKNPEKSIPQASRSILWRLTIFYVAAVAILLAIVPWKDVGVKVSPFVFVFQSVGVPAAPSLMNFVVLTAALSGANASLYAATRILYGLAKMKQAPKIFTGVSRKGVPLPALFGSAAGLAAVPPWPASCSSAGFYDHDRWRLLSDFIRLDCRASGLRRVPKAIHGRSIATARFERPSIYDLDCDSCSGGNSDHNLVASVYEGYVSVRNCLGRTGQWLLCSCVQTRH